MKKAKKSTVVAQLNIDVIAEILSRLCVKDLIRFKSVCKYWFQLISSKDFIKLHLQRSTSLRPISLGNRYFDIDCHRVRAPFAGESSNFCGSSCDGLVCLFNTKQSIIHIWNPALRSSACIPIKKCSPDIIIRCFWFGLHDAEYKLVLGTRELEMHVLRPYIDSCSYNWKSEQKLRDGYCTFNEIGTLVNGNVHWPVLKHHLIASNLDDVNGTDWKILSYNLHEEKVGEIGLPLEKHKYVGLGEVDGCLSAVFRYVPMELEIWSMKEYGLKESWTKMIVLNAECAIQFVRDICPRKDILNNPKSPLLMNSGKVVYNESLVSPKLRTERSLRSHKKSCRIILGVLCEKDT